MNEEAETGAQHAEEWLHQYHSLMEIFKELTFREKVHKLFRGLRQSPESGEYKWARFQLLRLSAPIAAVIVPGLVVLILMSLAVLAPDSRTVQVKIIEPERLEELEKIEEIIEEPLDPPEVEMDIPDEAMAINDYENPIPSPAQDFSPKPAELDSVAIIKSPVILKGILGSRNPGARGAALSGYGGSGATERSVLLALRWLKKNQSDDGSWPKVKPAMTSLALLTFLAHGETPASDEFGYTVESAIRWLLDNQNADGHFKGRDDHDYSQPIAAYALSEAFALTKIPMIKGAAEKAIKIVVVGQNPSGGWNYNCKPSDRNDTSYMGWCAQALKAAKLAGLEVEGLDNAMRMGVAGFRLNFGGNNEYGGFGYTGPSTDHGLTGVGVLCMQLLGHAKDPQVRAGLNTLERTTFNWDGTGFQNKNYYWYYITQAKFHAGNDIWNNWNRLFSPVLVKNQTVIPKEKSGYVDHKGNPRDIGYWLMEEKLSGNSDGDVMNTALCALQLQVYYRYLPTYKTPQEIDEEVRLEDDQGDIDIQIL